MQPQRLTDAARYTLVVWSRMFDWKNALVVVKPDTLIGWHRNGFRLFWRWKSRPGRPTLHPEIRALIVRMAGENPTWGQMRVAAELYLKLGILVSPRTVRKYWPWEPTDRGGRRASSQRWATFVRNHAHAIVACDFLVARNDEVPDPIRVSNSRTPCAGTGRSHVRLQCREPQAASGSRTTYADDEHAWEVGQLCSTSRSISCGVRDSQRRHRLPWSPFRASMRVIEIYRQLTDIDSVLPTRHSETSKY